MADESTNLNTSNCKSPHVFSGLVRSLVCWLLRIFVPANPGERSDQVVGEILVHVLVHFSIDDPLDMYLKKLKKIFPNLL